MASFDIETEYGPVHVVVNMDETRDQVHASVSTDHNRLRVRERDYSVHVHLWLIDGEWQTDADKREPWITRDGAKPFERAPKTIAAKIVAACREVVVSGVSSHMVEKVRAEAVYRRIVECEAKRNKLLQEAHDLTLAIAKDHERLAEVDPNARFRPDWYQVPTS